VADDKRQFWINQVADFETSGLSQRAYAEQKQISLSNLRYWMYKLRNESRPLAPEQAESAPEQRRPRRARRLLAVDVVASAAPKARPPEAGCWSWRCHRACGSASTPASTSSTSASSRARCSRAHAAAVSPDLPGIRADGHAELCRVYCYAELADPSCEPTGGSGATRSA